MSALGKKEEEEEEKEKEESSNWDLMAFAPPAITRAPTATRFSLFHTFHIVLVSVTSPRLFAQDSKQQEKEQERERERTHRATLAILHVQQQFFSDFLFLFPFLFFNWEEKRREKSGRCELLGPFVCRLLGGEGSFYIGLQTAPQPCPQTSR